MTEQSTDRELARTDEVRDAVLRAAKTYDEFHERIRKLENDVFDLTTLAASKQARIEQLEVSLAEERNRASVCQSERDDAVAASSELLAVFHLVKAQLDTVVTPLPELPSQRKRRNGKAATLSNEALTDTQQPPTTEPSFDRRPLDNHGD